MSRIIARDSEKSGDDNLRGFGEPRSHTSSDWDPAAVVGIAGGTVLKGEEFSQIIVGISNFAEAVFWGQHLWARGYWVATSGNVTDEVWKEYIKNQKPPEPDDAFDVV